MPLKVLFSAQAPDNPSKVIRVLEPLRQLAAAGIVEPLPIETDPAAALAALSSAHAVFLHLIDMNTESAPTLWPFLAEAKRQNVRLICDTDDPYLFGPEGYTFEEALAPHLELRKRLYAEADVVSLTTRPLQEELAGVTRNSLVIPNAIDLPAAPQRPGGNARLRLGWCGGPTHMDDLARVLPAIARLQRRHPVEFIIFGMFDQNFANTVERVRKVPRHARAQDPKVAAFGRMADALAEVAWQHVPSVPYDRFMPRLAELNFDVGLCPILDTRFNRCRSAVKYYQYAACNTLTVASNVGPYREGCTLLVENTTAAWVDMIERLIHDPAERAAHLHKQRTYVAEHRSWQVVLPLYEKLLCQTGTS